MSTARAALAGTWRLASWEARTPDGDLIGHPFGADVAGLLTYDPAGFVQGQMMRCDRPPFSTPRRAAIEFGAGGPGELAQAFNSYFAYNGTFEIETDDERTGRITHHVMCALIPGWVGSRQDRWFSIDANRLVLRTPNRTVERIEQIGVLTWARALALGAAENPS